MKFRPFDPRGEVLRHRGNLPHWRQQGATYFITGRLGDAVPQAKMRQWAQERATWLQARGLRSEDEVEKLSGREQWRFREWFGARIHRWLDAGYGDCWMKRADIAQTVANALTFADGKNYAL